jgi:hypothetical protein
MVTNVGEKRAQPDSHNDQDRLTKCLLVEALRQMFLLYRLDTRKRIRVLYSGNAYSVHVYSPFSQVVSITIGHEGAVSFSLALR